jgi:hypothetical protein
VYDDRYDLINRYEVDNLANNANPTAAPHAARRAAEVRRDKRAKL